MNHPLKQQWDIVAKHLDEVIEQPDLLTSDERREIIAELDQLLERFKAFEKKLSK